MKVSYLFISGFLLVSFPDNLYFIFNYVFSSSVLWLTEVFFLSLKFKLICLSSTLSFFPLLFCFQSCHSACRILVLWLVIKPSTQRWKSRVLTTEQPGNFQHTIFKTVAFKQSYRLLLIQFQNVHFLTQL